MMKPTSVVTIALLLFLAASIAVLVAKGLRQEVPEERVPGRAVEAAPSDRNAAPLGDGVIAYYFHGNMRCPTCRTIEAYAHEAVEASFKEQLANGTLKWRVVNYEAAGNEHFVTDYEIVAPTVVLVQVDGGSQKQWKDLGRVWELVGDKEAFVQYVQEETRALLAGSSG